MSNSEFTILPRLPMLNLQVSIGSYLEFSRAIIDIAEDRISSYICVANVHMLVEAHRNVTFAKVVNEAVIVTPDGKPLTWALNLLHGMKQDRVAGMDLLPDLIEAAIQKKLPVFFYGGSPLLLSSTEIFLNSNYPQLNVAGLYSPPFRDLTQLEEREVAERINKSGAKLVFVVLGCPKQEKWMGRMKGKINAVMIGVGGALPVFIGQQKRAPFWMQNYGLEWFFRLLQEPRRLFHRYAVTNSHFCWLLFKAWAKKKIGKQYQIPAVEIRNNLHQANKTYSE